MTVRPWNSSPLFQAIFFLNRLEAGLVFEVLPRVHDMNKSATVVVGNQVLCIPVRLERLDAPSQIPEAFPALHQELGEFVSARRY